MGGNKAQHEENSQIDVEFFLVDGEVNIPPGILLADIVAYKVACKGGKGRSVYAEKQHQDHIENNVHNRCNETRPEGVGGVVSRCVNTAEKLVQAHHEYGGHQHRRVEIGRAVFRELTGIDEQGRQRLYKDDHSCTGYEQEGCIGIKDPLVKAAPVLGILLHDGRHIPGLEENRGEHGDQIGYLAGNAVDSGGALTDQTLRAGHVPDEYTVRKTGDRPEQGGGDQGDCKYEHIPHHRAFQLSRPEIPAQAGDHPQEDGRKQVGADNGQHKACNAQLETGNEENIEKEQRKCGQNAVKGKELYHSLRADELGIHRPHGRGRDIADEQPRVPVCIGKDAQHGRDSQQQKDTESGDGAGGGIDPCSAVAAIQSEPDDGLRHGKGNDGYEEICGNFQQLLGAVVGRVDISRVQLGQEQQEDF